MIVDVLREVVLPHLDRVKKSGAGFMAQCPAHEDGTASLSISAGTEQPVVFHCHAGCPTEDIIAKLGINWEDVSKPRDDRQPRRDGNAFTHSRWAAVYDYVDEGGALLFQVLRSHDKDFRQRVKDLAGKDGWSWKLGNTRRVPYRLPQVLAAVRDGREVWICEGEKDVHTLEAAGIVATCNPGGAGKWRPEYSEFFREAIVTIVADRDEPGRAHARQVRDALVPVAGYVRIVEATSGKDVTDHVRAGCDLLDLDETFTTEPVVKVDLAPDLWEFIATEDAPHDWIVPELLERGDRVILTGFEGLGKSVLGRQMAVTLAAGVHPFLPHRSIEPQRVLVIDCENSERQGRRKFRALAEVSINRGCRVPDGGLRLIHRPEGIDLTRNDDAEWLLERVTAHKPTVLFIGPFYRLHNANINEELPARKTVAVLDQARTAADCALIIEAHAGHGEAGKGRSVRPTGSSLLLRWPEFGFGIAPCQDPEPGRPCMDVEIRHWRGQRDERAWPAYLKWGDPGDWPWQTSFGPPVKKAAP
jgi:hypothetical protein